MPPKAKVPALQRALLLVALALLACGAAGSAPGAGAPDGSVQPDARTDAPTTCPSDPTVPCEPFLSCGCTAIQKCAPGATGLSCQTAGAGQPGDACTDDGGCARGSLCVKYAGALVCHAFCDAGHPCGSGTSCYILAGDGTGTPVARICGPSCRLLSQDCPASLGCYPADEASDVDHGVCLTPGGGGQGSACGKNTDCALGFSCIDPSGPETPICAKICDRRAGGASCPQTTVCHPFASSSAESQTGVCLP